MAPPARGAPHPGDQSLRPPGALAVGEPVGRRRRKGRRSGSFGSGGSGGGRGGEGRGEGQGGGPRPGALPRERERGFLSCSSFFLSSSLPEARLLRGLGRCPIRVVAPVEAPSAAAARLRDRLSGVWRRPQGRPADRRRRLRRRRVAPPGALPPRQGLDGRAPDAFDARGQAWGFPTYDWEAAAAEGFAWWRARLSRMAKFFHALRIDHVLGFFRIWELEPGAITGACGRFRPARPVSRRELLEGAGLWDIDRLTKPHITRELAARALSPAAARLLASSASSSPSAAASPAAASPSSATAAALTKEVDSLIDRFLEPVPGVPGRLRFRAAVDSEAAIDALGRGGKVKESSEASSSPSSTSVSFEALRQGLLSLRQNVCLIEDPDLFDDGGGGEGENFSSAPSSSEERSSHAAPAASAASAAAAAEAGRTSPPPPRHPNALPLLHPRFNLTSTPSFCELGPQGWRDALARLHDDYYYGT